MKNSELKCLPALNPNDFEGNVGRICEFLGLSSPEEVGKYLSGFQVRESIYDIFSAKMGEGIFKIGAILLYAAVRAGGGCFKVDKEIIRSAFGADICSNLKKHKSVAALLHHNDPDVSLDFVSIEPIVSGVCKIIDEGYEIASIAPDTAPSAICKAVNWVYMLVERGELRVAEKRNGVWVVNESVKKAFPLSFRVWKNEIVAVGNLKFYDKIPQACFAEGDFARAGFRKVYGSSIRRGCYIAPGVIVMPSFVNVGAYIDEGTVLDSGVTVGSCAQIGKRVHLSSNVVIGGVLEPINERPVIIEDGVRIGACSSVTEGVLVEEGAILASNVHLSQSSRIYDRRAGTFLFEGDGESKRIPAGSLVVPGSYRAKVGDCNIDCAVIAQRVDADSLRKFDLNSLLREALAN